jgi:hypothetical protein
MLKIQKLGANGKATHPFSNKKRKDTGPHSSLVMQLLKDLAAKINESHEAGEAAINKGLAYFYLAGKSLLKAKEYVGHGAWLIWLKTNCPKVSPRRSQQYMKLAKCEVTSFLGEKWKVISGNAPKEEPTQKNTASEGGNGKHKENQGKGSTNGYGKEGETDGAHIRTIPLVLTKDNIEDFESKIEALGKAFGKDNTTDIVCEAVNRCYKALNKEVKP